MIPKLLILAWTRRKYAHVAVFPWTINNICIVQSRFHHMCLAPTGSLLPSSFPSLFQYT